MSFKPKILVLALMLFTSLSSYAQTMAKPVVTETNRFIVCEYTPGIFPLVWRLPPHSMKAKSLDKSKVDTAISAVKQALSRYPAGFLKKYLKTVYLLEGLTTEGIEIGGTIWWLSGVVYISLSDNDTVWLCEALYHEIGHLVTAYPRSRFSEQDWTELNAAAFHYGKGGFETFKAGKHKNEPNVNYYSQGFVSQYAKSSVDEDFAEISQHLMSGNKEFWAAVDKYPILRKKATYTIKTHSNLDKAFTESYFRGLPSAALVVQTFRYQPGDTLYFSKGGEVTLPLKAQGKSKILQVASGGLAVYAEGMGIVFYKEGKASTSPVVIPPDSEMHFLLDGAFVIRRKKADKVSLPQNP